MRHAVSVSLGSATRNHDGEISLLGERVRITRIGTDGDVRRAERLIRELDGTVEALGLGGAAFHLRVGDRVHPFHSLRRLARAARRTPLVDGAALKHALERSLAPWLAGTLGEDLGPRRAFFPMGVDRWDLAASFADAGWECRYGDLGLALGIPFPLRSSRALARVACLTMPILGRVPFSWLYPTGARQETRRPSHTAWFTWATVVAGDFHYIRRHMPSHLDAVVCTNTTTRADVELLRAAGVRTLVTTTPLVDGRTFGTNLMEAALLAASGAPHPVDAGAMAALVRRAGLAPTLRRLERA